MDKGSGRAYLSHYCLTRADLPPGAQAAQLIHAAGKSSPGNLPDGTYAIALLAKDESDLCALAARLKMAGIERCLIIEADAPYAGQAMAIGIAPTDRKLLKKHLSTYPLLK